MSHLTFFKNQATSGNSPRRKQQQSRNMAGRIVLALLASVLAAASASPSYCTPKIEFYTETETQIQQVPVYSTVYETRNVPSTSYRIQYETKYETSYVPQVQTTYVTMTVTKKVPDFKTTIDTQLQTRLKTVFYTETKRVPTYVTETQYQTSYMTTTKYQTVYQTKNVPQQVTNTQVQVVSTYVTQTVPEYHTTYVTQRSYQTVCHEGGQSYGK
ncbi:hypothetical protein C7M84_024448 [Penaeus vannamei]|uniref:Uncharacterized protein n=1 Tax=Penaeus vannamei TaxID=6689 RepID=A0A3R7MI77_PENVA|nr:hypothetical protein C7M84_024448 [Penaeus vannamei]